MHEFSIVSHLFKILEDYKKQHQIKRIRKISVKIGEISGVETELFEYAFETLKNFDEFKQFKNVSLEIRKIEAKARCLECKKIFRPEGFIFICPHCNSVKTEIISGDELLLEKIEAEL